ncbi:hypothetical protein JCM19294_2631 [Nonlabens tegetincola]|uniref:Uncharacterized protein n=1 Tax=Nonlabens tegetincola TaxID=323273 RepID=A0A090PYB8_9FLAO|nr:MULTISPECIES: hypothetical protein [Nonlabens]PQJ20135.1 histidine kinase [Nonlabens tegetincola]GAK95849.1 hypothetical protein JCM19294_2631 [Nonlabens tegetincola]
MTEQPNRSYIDALCRGDKVFEEKLIKVIKLEFPNEVKVYHEAFNEKKQTKTAEAVHKLKHKISILGLENGYQTAVKYEDEIREGNYDLHKEFEAILNSMSTYLKTLE